MITVTLEAAKRLKKILDKNQSNNPEAGIRLAIRAGGCSGFVYIPLTVTAKPHPHDNVFESNGIRIFVDPKSLVIVKGTEIDHTGNLLDGFVFNNPNAKNNCGCGTSFEIK
jgi:iron-sulfur cluster assembly protein